MSQTEHTQFNESYHADDELIHWKYLKREKVKGKWRYWYDLDSLKKDAKTAISSLASKARKTVSSGKKNVDKHIDTPIKKLVKKISNNVKDTINAAKKKVHKYVAKVPTGGNTYRYFYSDEAYQAYIKGKKAVDKVLDKKLNVTPSEAAKANAKTFALKSLFGGFGKAVYNVVAPALTAIQVSLTTPKSFSELKKIDEDETNDSHQKKVNPRYKTDTYDYSMNCSFCTAAYDLRKRGYDVEANPISTVEAYTIEDICSWYKGAKSVSESTSTRLADTATRSKVLQETLKQYGDGARGHIGLYWSAGGGHDVIWEVEKGSVVFRDCQNGKTVNPAEYLEYSSSYDYVRTDNLDPTEDILRTVRNRKKR